MLLFKVTYKWDTIQMSKWGLTRGAKSGSLGILGFELKLVAQKPYLLSYHGTLFRYITVSIVTPIPQGHRFLNVTYQQKKSLILEEFDYMKGGMYLKMYGRSLQCYCFVMQFLYIKKYLLRSFELVSQTLHKSNCNYKRIAWCVVFCFFFINARLLVLAKCVV